MLQSDPDERLIYLACQHIFRGTNSQVRKLKAVKGLIKQNKVALTDILREYNIDRTSAVAKKLLKSQVFDSTLNARNRFPELFDVSPTLSAEREASEKEAARDEANTVREISNREVSKDITVTSHTEVEGEQTLGDNQVTSAKCSEQGRSTASAVRSLYPVEWTKIFSPQSHPLINNLRFPLDAFIGLLRELRHSAVHRLRKTAAGIERLAENAQLFLEALEDTNRSEKVEGLRRELRSAIEELKRNKDLFERRLHVQLKEIQNKRSELDIWEKNAKEAMIREDFECSRDISQGLEIIVQRVQLKDPKETEEEKPMPDVCSDSLDSEEEFLDAALMIPQF